ncbi:MAG TPA: VOC family protein [Phnomibacter sp.]|nr:VOC family protein [Phnomibacter sp.]
MATVSTYLTFTGKCEEAFLFYKSILGGEFSSFSRFGEMPAGSGPAMPDEDKAMVMHVSLPVGNSVLMGSDTGSQWAPNHKAGNNFSVSVNADSQEQADAIFNGLSAGGQVMMPMSNTFWGAYFGMFTDKFGINWMVNYDLPTVQG